MLQFQVARTNGLRYGSLSSSYSLHISRENWPIVTSCVTEADLVGVIGKMNEAIQSYWPCGIVYAFAICCPCCPNLCLAKAEEAARGALHQMSLKPCFFDNQIRFKLVKTWFSSFVVVEFPATAAARCVATHHMQLVTSEPHALGMPLKKD